MFSFIKKRLLLTTVICIIAISQQSFAYTNQDLINATKQINKFVDLEFNGDGCARNDADLVVYDKESQLEIKKNFCGGCIPLNAAPLIVVGSYNLESIHISGNRCTAVVSFRRLAKTIGLSNQRKFVMDFIEKELVEYSLIKSKGRWLVYIPPEFRISKKVITQLYEQWVQFRDLKNNKPDISEAQKNYFKANEEALETLKTISE